MAVQNGMGGAFGLLAGRTGGGSAADVAGEENWVQKRWRAGGLRRVARGRSGGCCDLPAGATCVEWWRQVWCASWMAERVEPRLAAWSSRRKEDATSPATWKKDRRSQKMRN